MVVKSQLKLIKSLHQKKNRIQHGLFIIEGEKGIADALANDLTPYKLLSSQGGSAVNSFEKISEKEFSQISALKNPNGYLGVFKIPKQAALDFKDWVVVLDGLQDPGNLGTIIRLCDWFGVKQILCSPDTVDCLLYTSTVSGLQRICFIPNQSQSLMMVPKFPGS